MSGFLPELERVYRFDGDDVRVRMRPLENKDLGPMMRYSEATGETDADGNPTYRIMDGHLGDFVEAVSSLLPRYVVSIDGLTDANGNTIGVQQVAGYQYFMGLVMDIGRDLMQQAQMDGESGKNSPERRGDSS